MFAPGTHIFFDMVIKTEDDLREMADRHFRGREVACPVCGVAPMNPCTRGAKGGNFFRSRGSHLDRIILAERMEAEGH